MIKLNIVRTWNYPRSEQYAASLAFTEYVERRLSRENYLVLDTSYDAGYRQRLAPDLLVVSTRTKLHCYVECKTPSKHNPVCELRELQYQRQLPAVVVVACRLPSGDEIGFLLDEPADRVYIPDDVDVNDDAYKRVKSFASAERARICRFSRPSKDKGSSLAFAWWNADRWRGQHWLDVVKLVLTEGVD